MSTTLENYLRVRCENLVANAQANHRHADMAFRWLDRLYQTCEANYPGSTFTCKVFCWRSIAKLACWTA